ncbi:MAG: YdcF family protein [Acidobacteriales bacterium]|nr:YdcF family protein [Terriglobales bacterium]
MPGRPSRRSRILILGALCALLAYAGINYYRVARQAGLDETRTADVIVVFGAAEYAGKPSPVYRARLDHALDLYQHGLAKHIIATGGHGEDVKFAEGSVGRDYLIAKGVPQDMVIAETQSEDTQDSARRVAGIMRANGLTNCLAVSDAYHMYRIKRMMSGQGIECFASPRPLAKPLSQRQKAAYYLREVLSLTLWRLGIT